MRHHQADKTDISRQRHGTTRQPYYQHARQQAHQRDIQPQPTGNLFSGVEHVHLPGEKAGGHHQQRTGEQHRVDELYVIAHKATGQPEQHGVETFLIDNKNGLGKGIAQRGDRHTRQHQPQRIKLPVADFTGKPHQRAGGAGTAKRQ